MASLPECLVPLHACLHAPSPAALSHQLHGGPGGGHRRRFAAAVLSPGVRNGENVPDPSQVLNCGSCTGCIGFFFSLSMTIQDKYFRLENINSPKILVKSILDYDVVQKISLVLHVQV